MKNTIKVLATKGVEPCFISESIMRFTKADFSHVLIMYNNRIVHSVGEGLMLLDLRETAEYISNHHVMRSFEVDLAVSEDYFYGFIKGSEGKDYSESQFIGFVAKFLAKYIVNKREKLICSEFVGQVLNLCCFDFCIQDLDFKSPKDIIDIIDWKISIGASNVKNI